MAAAEHQIGSVQLCRGQLEDALSHTINAIRILKDRGYAKDTSGSLCQLGMVFLAMDDPAQAMECFKERLRIEEGSGSLDGTMLALSDLGSAYIAGEAEDKAQETFRQALAVAERLGRPEEECRIGARLAQLAARKARYQESLTYLHDSTKRARDADQSEVLSLLHTARALVNLLHRNYTGSLMDLANAVRTLAQRQSPATDLVQKSLGIMMEEMGEDTFRQVLDNVPGYTRKLVESFMGA
jgi:tetratricopeptide (TPR) repeat protein